MTDRPHNHDQPVAPAVPAVGFSQEHIRELLARVARGEVSPDAATESLRHLPFEDLGFANLDHHRCLRRHFPEVVFCAGKTIEQVAIIVERFAQRSERVLGTRATPEHFAAAQKLVPELQYDPLSRALWLDRSTTPKYAGVVVLAGGTSDMPVAEEAAHTLEVMGHAATRIYDVGVAGLHRLLNRLPALEQANVIIAVAGMEGALPSVVAGLVSAPVIAVPTSVGYGAAFGGLSALLTMLNSCAPGIAVVNIDNGFGAGYMAASINHAIVHSDHQAKKETPAHAPKH